MLPVVDGEAETRRQILLYGWLLLAITALPVAGGLFGAVYAVAAAAARRGFPVAVRPPPPARRPALGRDPVPLLARSTSRCCSARWPSTASSESDTRMLRASMDRKLARRNIVTGLVAAALAVMIFGAHVPGRAASTSS